MCKKTRMEGGTGTWYNGFMSKLCGRLDKLGGGVCPQEEPSG